MRKLALHLFFHFKYSDSWTQSSKVSFFSGIRHSVYGLCFIVHLAPSQEKVFLVRISCWLLPFNFNLSFPPENFKTWILKLCYYVKSHFLLFFIIIFQAFEWNLSNGNEFSASKWNDFHISTSSTNLVLTLCRGNYFLSCDNIYKKVLMSLSSLSNNKKHFWTRLMTGF